MLRGEKILITGPAGRIALGIARSLAARQRGVGDRALQRSGDARAGRGARGDDAHASTSSDGDFGDLPTDFTYLLHIAADFSADDYERALRVNAEGTGLRPRALPEGEGGAGDVDAQRLQAASRSVARVPRGRSARRRHAAGAAAVLGLEDRRGGGGPLLRALVRPARHDRPHGRGLRRHRRPAGLAPRRGRRGPAGGRALGSDAVRADPRRRHLRSARSAARCGERAGDDRQLVRRRAGQRAGVVGLLRRAARRFGEGRRAADPGRVRSGRSATSPSARRSPGRAGSDGATASGAWPSTSIPTVSSPPARAAEAPEMPAFPDADALLAEVSEARGLSDFGPPDFREGLTVLLESLNERLRFLARGQRAGARRPAPAADQPARGRGLVRAAPRDRRPSRARAGRHQRPAAHRHHRAGQRAVARPAVPLACAGGSRASPSRRRASRTRCRIPAGCRPSRRTRNSRPS